MTGKQIQSLRNKIMILPEQNYQKKLNDLYKRQILASRFQRESEQWQTVLKIIRDVAYKGDKALIDYTLKFDKVKLTPKTLEIKPAEMRKAHRQIDKELLESIRRSIANVKQYQKSIFIGNRNSFKKQTGIKYIPLQRVGVCIPGAAAPLPSTMIMTAVPAMVAGVKEIIVVSPPRYQGSIHPVILAVCYELSSDKDYPDCRLKVFRVGGAQAVAALASDKGTIPKVDKIVGPGNKWVQTAKKFVSGDYVGIDSIAGPSEVLIIADKDAKPVAVAADMLSQAEHGTDSSAVVITNSKVLADKVFKQLVDQVKKLTRSKEAVESLKNSSAIIEVGSMKKAIELANEMACEHLQIQCGRHSRKIAEQIHNAGAIFIGDYAPVAVGDYWAGPSHTLPTGRTARFASALTSNDFVKSISLIEYSRGELANDADDIIRLAHAEGLDAHARSVAIRRNPKRPS